MIYIGSIKQMTGNAVQLYRYRVSVEFGPSSSLRVSTLDVVAGDRRAAVFLGRRPFDRDVIFVTVRNFRLAWRVRLVCKRTRQHT